MKKMEKTFRKKGYQTVNYDYPSRQKTIEELRQTVEFDLKRSVGDLSDQKQEFEGTSPDDKKAQQQAKDIDIDKDKEKENDLGKKGQDGESEGLSTEEQAEEIAGTSPTNFRWHYRSRSFWPTNNY